MVKDWFAAPKAAPFEGSEQTFKHVEETGLRLANAGRIVALLVFAVWIAFSRGNDPVRLHGYFLLLTVFFFLGSLHFALIGTRFDKVWVKYAFTTIDIVILSTLIATVPLYHTAEGLPSAMIFRSSIFPIYFLVVGVAAFSLSPGLVLWSGVAGAVGWLGAFFYVIGGAERVLDWDDIPPGPTREDVTRVLLDPNFAGSGSRIQEAIALILLAFLVAVVIWRARLTVRRQLEAERERTQISGLFGRFVPETVVEAMIAHEGLLEPREREATVLFADIVGFTSMTERRGAVPTLQMLNVYFEEVTRIIGGNNGIVTQFIGDAVMATFNVPVEDDNHASHAFNAAREILTCVSERTFAGESISVRIGICTGDLVAGNVGGGGRQSYTVYGDPVNIAARLEALCKDLDVPLLLSETTARAVPNARFVEVGRLPVRGIAAPVTVFSGAVVG